jgi:putative metallohydrolase (TIGR04338 family)
MRDFQKSLFFESQYKISQGKRFYSQRGIQRYVDSFISSRWWKNRFLVNHVEVYVIKDRRAVHAYCICNSIAEGSIHLPMDMWRELIVLHELAHLVTPEYVADHGSNFCMYFLELIKKKMGRHYRNKLKSEFIKNNVKFTRTDANLELDNSELNLLDLI